MKNLTLVRMTSEKKPMFTRIKPAAIMTGLAWAFSATLAACVLMYAWVVLSASPVYYLGTQITAAATLGALAGGMAAGRAARILGLVHGFLAGLGYGLLLMAFFMLGSAAGISPMEIAARVLLLGIIGALGGLLGINIPFGLHSKPVLRTGKKILEKDLLFPRRN